MITPQQALEMMQRLAQNRKDAAPAKCDDSVFEPVSKEIPLHGQIMKWCQDQHPQVPLIHTNPTKSSRATPGAPDFVLVYRGKVLLIECKKRDGKLSPDQRLWHHLAELQGVPVAVVRSMDEFLYAISHPDTGPGAAICQGD